MYIPKHFSVADKTELAAFIDTHGFGQIISLNEGRLFSTHIPFMIEDDCATLIGHLARANSQWRDMDTQEVLVTFQGPHDYISPTWMGPGGLPTWNYQAVHVYGRCRVIEDPGHIEKTILSLINKYESKFPNPWDPVYDAARFKHIVGLEIEISEMQGKFKLSQNRTVKDRQSVIEQLQSLGVTELAEAMKKQLP